MSTSSIVLINQRRRTRSSASSSSSSSSAPTPAQTQSSSSKASILQKKIASSNATKKANDETMSSPSESSSIPLFPEETGSGTYQDPFRLPPTRNLPSSSLHNVTNKSGCLVCPISINSSVNNNNNNKDSKCDCVFFTDCLNKAIAEVNTKRITSQAGRRDLCAKSILPCFMNRMIKVMDMMNTNNNTNNNEKTFIDFGSGNGSVLFYIAWVTGIDCVGVELSPHNTEHAKQLWTKLKPMLEKRKSAIRQQYFNSRTSKKNEIGNVTMICGDICDFIREHMMTSSSSPSAHAMKAQKAPSSHNNHHASSTSSDSSSSSTSSQYDKDQITKIFTSPTQQIYIWTANLLMPKLVTHFMSECFRQRVEENNNNKNNNHPASLLNKVIGLPIGTKIMAFDDLYPHGRAVARVRDPEVFETFEMIDFMWQLGSVEWTEHVEGMFHLYIKKM